VQWRNWSYELGANLAEGSRLANTQNSWEKNNKPGIERLYKNPKSPENTPKNAKKKQQSIETKRIVNTKIQAT